MYILKIIIVKKKTIMMHHLWKLKFYNCFSHPRFLLLLLLLPGPNLNSLWDQNIKHKNIKVASRWDALHKQMTLIQIYHFKVKFKNDDPNHNFFKSFDIKDFKLWTYKSDNKGRYTALTTEIDSNLPFAGQIFI